MNSNETSMLRSGIWDGSIIPPRIDFPRNDAWLVSLGDLLTLLLCFFLANVSLQAADSERKNESSQIINGHSSPLTSAGKDSSGSSAAGTDPAKTRLKAQAVTSRKMQVGAIYMRDFIGPNGILSMEAKERLGALCAAPRLQAFMCAEVAEQQVARREIVRRVMEALSECAEQVSVVVTGAGCAGQAPHMESYPRAEESPLVVLAGESHAVEVK